MNWTRLWKTGTGSDAFFVEKGDWPADLRLAPRSLAGSYRASRRWRFPAKPLCMLRGAFGTRGSVDPCLDPGEAQTDFLISKIREGWREGVPAVRVIAPVLDPARLASRAKAVAESSEAESTAAEPFANGSRDTQITCLAGPGPCSWRATPRSMP